LPGNSIKDIPVFYKGIYGKARSKSKGNYGIPAMLQIGRIKGFTVSG
jgi:hypothetical protein